MIDTLILMVATSAAATIPLAAEVPPPTPISLQEPEAQEPEKDMVDKTVGGVVQTGKNIVSLPGRAVGSFSSDELPSLVAGTSELGLSGNVQFVSDTIYNLDLSYGHFFKDNWQVGFTANAFGADDFNIGAGLFTEYNWTFEDSKWVPYVGASLKWAKVDTKLGGDTSSTAYGGELGLKYFIRSDVAIFGGINFEWSPDDVFGVGGEIEDSAENINFGMRFYL